MDGYKIARSVRMTPGIENIPIIAVTSCAMAGDREMIPATGTTDYIEKPVNPATFIDMIGIHFSR